MPNTRRKWMHLRKVCSVESGHDKVPTLKWRILWVASPWSLWVSGAEYPSQHILVLNTEQTPCPAAVHAPAPYRHYAPDVEPVSLNEQQFTDIKWELHIITLTTHSLSMKGSIVNKCSRCVWFTYCLYLQKQKISVHLCRCNLHTS